MFERFSDAARQAIVLAEIEARELGHAEIGTEHILLGIFREGEESGRGLDPVGVSLAGLRDLVVQENPRGGANPAEHPPFTAQAKQLLVEAFTEMKRGGHEEITPPHLLLAVLADPGATGVRAMSGAGINPSALRQTVADSLPPPVERSEFDQLGEQLVEWQRRFGGD